MIQLLKCISVMQMPKIHNVQQCNMLGTTYCTVLNMHEYSSLYTCLIWQDHPVHQTDLLSQSAGMGSL